MDLEADAKLFARQAHRILATFESTRHNPTVNCCKKSHVPTREACVLNLHDRWSDFNKNLLIHSAVGGYSTRTGITLGRAVNLSPIDNPITSLRHMQRGNPPTYWEPKWTITTDYLTACRQLGIANNTNVAAAIGVFDSPSHELRIARNYLAHKNTQTALKVIQELGALGAQSPLDLDTVITTYVSGGTTLFEHWVNKLVLIAYTACD